MPRCTVGSRQAEHKSHRESMEEDDMVISRQYPSTGDEPMGVEGGYKPEEYIRGG